MLSAGIAYQSTILPEYASTIWEMKGVWQGCLGVTSDEAGYKGANRQRSSSPLVNSGGHNTSQMGFAQDR